jgi:hypothetical protein
MGRQESIRTTYEWHFVERFPPTYLEAPRFIETFRGFIKTGGDGRADFEERLREASLHALTLDDPSLVRRGLQCLAIVGQVQDTPLLTRLLAHREPLIVRDAKTCLFEIEHRRDGPSPSAAQP